MRGTTGPQRVRMKRMRKRSGPVRTTPKSPKKRARANSPSSIQERSLRDKRSTWGGGEEGRGGSMCEERGEVRGADEKEGGM